MSYSDDMKRLSKHSLDELQNMRCDIEFDKRNLVENKYCLFIFKKSARKRLEKIALAIQMKLNKKKKGVKK